MILWILLFAGAAVVIAIAGWVLIRSVDAISERTGLGRAFLGMILVATITSLPELSTGISAITVADAPAIALGDIVGACMINLLLFVLADVVSGRKAFYKDLSSSHYLTGAFGVILLGVLALGLLAPANAHPAIGHVSLFSVLLVVLYIGAAGLLHVVDVRTVKDVDETPRSASMSLRGAILRCVGAGVAVTAAGAALAVSAEAIAEAAGLSHSTVGVLLVAIATTLPELVTMLAAVRLKFYDLAASGLLGSNLFNMVVLAINDVAYTEGPIFVSDGGALAGPVIIAMAMTAMAIGAIAYAERGAARLVDRWADLGLIVLYLAGAWLAVTATSF